MRDFNLIFISRKFIQPTGVCINIIISVGSKLLDDVARVAARRNDTLF
jgi:hypothetical protein